MLTFQWKRDTDMQWDRFNADAEWNDFIFIAEFVHRQQNAEHTYTIPTRHKLIVTF